MLRIGTRSAVVLPLGALALLVAGLTAGCNTVRGVGEDVAAVGNTTAKGAQATENKLFGSGEQSAQAPAEDHQYHPSPAYSAPGY